MQNLLNFLPAQILLDKTIMIMARTGSKPGDIKNILKKVLTNLEKKDKGPKAEILHAWENIVEPRAIHHTRPISISRRILTVEVDSSAWLYELSLQKRNMLKAMKQYIKKGVIEDIRFKMGEIA